MRWCGLVLILPLLAPVHCGNGRETAPSPPAHRRGMEPEGKGYLPLAPAARAIQWEHSAGVFIGVQEFHADSGLTVAYAADDAVDLAYLLTRELELLPPRRTTLLLAGRPSKESSRRSLEELRMEATVVEDDERGFGPRKSIDAATVASAVRARAREVKQGGVLVLCIATHGLLVGGEHLLLTADASMRDPHGILLATILNAIKAERPERLLLLIDACRKQPTRGLWPGQWASRPPTRFLEDVDLQQIPYAVLASTGPGGYAYSDDSVQNGYFTNAVVDGLRGKASTMPDGCVTLNSLETYVSDHVRQLSHGFQQTESRVGGLGRLRIGRCGKTLPAGQIVRPKRGDIVDAYGIVEIHVSQPELFATVLVCARKNNVCYNQNPSAKPVLTQAGGTPVIAVQYGSIDTYRVYVALTADPNFLSGKSEWPYVPLNEGANRIVHWNGPVEVTRIANDRRKKP